MADVRMRGIAVRNLWLRRPDSGVPHAARTSVSGRTGRLSDPLGGIVPWGRVRRALCGRSAESVSAKFIAAAPGAKRRNPLRQYPSGRNRTLPPVPHPATRAEPVRPFNGFAGFCFARSHFVRFRRAERAKWTGRAE